MEQRHTEPIVYRAYSSANISTLPQFRTLSRFERDAIETVSRVLPFRVNNYIAENLIDWTNIPSDPIFQLTFPQKDMLPPGDYRRLRALIASNSSDVEIEAEVRRIRLGLNPHPAGQLALNVPELDGSRQTGMQHKYRETVLFFPRQGQTCHAYCTYCFRWPQFVGMEELKFAARDVRALVRYLKRRPEVRDVIFTGGDPLIMRAHILRSHIEPLLKLESVRSIRIGSKAPAWWPYRFVTDRDAGDLLRLFEDVVEAGKHLAVMAHYSHPRELSTGIALQAVRRIQATGAVIRSQAPLIRRVNDCADLWAAMWQKQVEMGIVPYYMFVERDTGPRRYFEVPLHRAVDIFGRATRQVSGLGRTVRGPSMSCTPGKVMIEGVTEIHGQRVFVLKFIQARNPSWTNRVFFARYDEAAAWLDDLTPAFDRQFFFERDLASMDRWKNIPTHPGLTPMPA